MTDSMKDKIRLAISKAGQKKDFKTIDMLEKMISGSLPINYSLIDKIINEEVSDPSEQIRNQQEIIRDLRDRISQTENNEEKQSLQLKLNVAQAKLEELQNRQSTQNISEDSITDKVNSLKNDLSEYLKRPRTRYKTTDRDFLPDVMKKKDWLSLMEYIIKNYGIVNLVELKSILAKWNLDVFDFMNIKEVAKKLGVLKEEAPYQKLRFLDTDNNGNTIQDEKIEESVYVLRDYNTRRFLSASGRPTDRNGAQRYYSKEQAQRSAKALKSRGIYAELDKLDEGCMTKKLEDMDNRQLAKYIFNHPNTKFADKIKECDVVELMKAIKELKKDEDAPVTSTAAVATYSKPFFKETLKR